MSEPRRSTRARAREEAAPAPETPKETPAKGAKSSLKRKRPSAVAKAATPATNSPQGSKQTLPLRIRDGQPLPTLPEPQPLELSSAEWQDIQQSGVLGASLDRSRAVWVSGVNFRVFHKHFSQPKKPADRTDEDKAKNTRQKDLLKNFPELGKDASLKDAAKDTEVQAQLVIEPHTFPIRLFAPREIMKSQPKKVSGPSYGAWPNHNQPQHSQPNQYTQYNSQGQPVYQPKPPQPRPPPPKPVQKAPAPAPGPASTPAPDPVIHMLAQRAGVDPELKSVMKIVAAGQASKEQLEFFQTHINELTAVLAKQKKEEAAKAAKLLPASATPKAQYHPPRQPPAQHSHQPVGYRPIVFSFEEGNKDLLHFPSYSFLEWLPNMSGAKISFLITKMKPKPEQDTIVKPPSTPAPKPTATLSANATPAATPNATAPNTMGFAQTPTNPFHVTTPSTPATFVPQPRIEDFNEKKDIADIEFYQPVTVLLLTDNNEIRSALVRAIRPPDVVEKYMDEVFDKCRRAGETYLAFRLPRDADAETADKRARSGDITPASATPTLDRRFSGVGSHFGSALSALDKKKGGRIRRSVA
ncbi:hypothetical protein BDU57DRAFT_558825 [Ampelomyces quisqualis]|uniref:SWR1-complex protein 3 domain-containing protein n=1 Tax=Ampelomyces quisqualis TaxID=50730 RepID=A0A6A5QGQ3_AMPQU|nr:hypothetical protein BDU57DRAFT_558825 [Ampelomyces quisqualis]